MIQASGKDVATLLQDLLTCNIDLLDAQPIIWGFLLTPQGRFLHELFIIKHEDGFLLDVQSDNSEAFLKRLRLYTLKSDASFALLEGWGVAASAEIFEHHASMPDPRLKAMGHRVYDTLEALKLLPNMAQDMAPYQQYRIAHTVPAAEDFIPERTLLLDYDVDQLGGH